MLDYERSVELEPSYSRICSAVGIALQSYRTLPFAVQLNRGVLPDENPQTATASWTVLLDDDVQRRYPSLTESQRGLIHEYVVGSHPGLQQAVNAIGYKVNFRNAAEAYFANKAIKLELGNTKQHNPRSEKATIETTIDTAAATIQAPAHAPWPVMKPFEVPVLELGATTFENMNLRRKVANRSGQAIIQGLPVHVTLLGIQSAQPLA